MHFSSTDLPVPEPPITTMEVPGITSMIDAVQHLLVAEALGRGHFGPRRPDADFRGVFLWLAHRAKNNSVST